MRFVFATAVAMLAVSIAAAQTVSPTAAQKKKVVAQKKAVAKVIYKKTWNQCVDLAYQRGFSDGASGGSGSFIWRCRRGEQH